MGEPMGAWPAGEPGRHDPSPEGSPDPGPDPSLTPETRLEASLRAAGAVCVAKADAAPQANDHPTPSTPCGPLLVFDGGCPFCRHFAELSELRGGIAGLRIRDGRADDLLRRQLRRRGWPLHRGAIVLDGDRVLHGAAAIHWLCERMTPSDPLLGLLAVVFSDRRRSGGVYPLLLLARRLALAVRKLPEDPDRGWDGRWDDQLDIAAP